MYENHPIMQIRPSIDAKQNKNPQNDYFVGNYYPTPVAVPPAFYPQNNETQLVSRYTQPVNSLYGNHRPQPINYQIQTDNAKNEIDKITTGNTIKHILSSDMKKFSLLFPCVKEQIQIGRFFKQLDETLALQQQQLQTLKNLKQAFLEKMFV